MARSFTLHFEPDLLAIVRLPAGDGLPWWAAAGGGFLSFTRDTTETSVVCPAARVPPDVRAERGFQAFRLQGPIPFDEVGVLASLAAVLAAARVPIFVVSTFDTDYVLVPEPLIPAATAALRDAGHTLIEGDARAST